MIEDDDFEAYGHENVDEYLYDDVPSSEADIDDALDYEHWLREGEMRDEYYEGQEEE